MKHVFDQREVAHVWAHQTQADGRSNGRGNIYFEGSTIYSYGSHFPIARHIENNKGQKGNPVYDPDLFNHHGETQRICTNAIPGSVDIFYTGGVNDKPSVAMLDNYQTEINELAMKAERSKRFKDMVLEDLNSKIESFSILAKFIGSERTPKIPNQEWIARQKVLARKQAKEVRQRKIARETEQRAKDEKDFQAWLAGESNWFPGSYRGFEGSDYLRIEGDEVVTSSSARVPIDHVRKIVPFVLGLIDEGRTYKKNGHTVHLGHYPLESIDEQGMLTVGCHHFSKTEILRFAKLL